MYTGNSKKLGKLINKNGFDYAEFLTEYNGAYIHALHYEDKEKDKKLPTTFAKVTFRDAEIVKNPDEIKFILGLIEKGISYREFDAKKIYAVMVDPCQEDRKLVIKTFDGIGNSPECVIAEDDTAEGILESLGIKHKSPKRVFPGWETLSIGEGAFLVARSDVADILFKRLREKSVEKRMQKYEKKIMAALTDFLTEKAWMHAISKHKNPVFGEDVYDYSDKPESIIGIFVGGITKREEGVYLEVYARNNGELNTVGIDGDCDCLDYLDKIGINLEENDFFDDWKYLNIDEEDFFLLNKSLKLNMDEALEFADKIQMDLRGETANWCKEHQIRWKPAGTKAENDRRMRVAIAEYIVRYSA